MYAGNMEAAQVREKIRWPWWLMGLVIALDISIVIAVWAGLGNSAALASIFIVIALTIAFYFFTALNINIADGEVFVGRAHISVEHIGQVEVLSAEKMKLAYGMHLNPAAHLALRFWVKGGLKLTIDDQRDPTPYWLVSSKNPEKIESAILGKN